MKSTAIAILLLAASAAAQIPGIAAQRDAAAAQAVRQPSYSDMYCAGFMTNQRLSTTNMVVAGLDSPHQTRFAENETIYLRADGLEVGQQLALLRRTRDPNQREAFSGQRSMLRGLGDLYAEMGRARVLQTNGEYAIAHIEFSCDAVVPGDFAVPWLEKHFPQFRRSVRFERFPQPTGMTRGRIVQARDFDQVLGNRRKVYLNVGSDQGVQVGDYFRVVRTYDDTLRQESEAVSFSATTMEDTQADTFMLGRDQLGRLPRRALGEMIVLSVSPRTSTAMLTYAVEAINVGDEVEGVPEPPAPPEEPAPAANPPSISCFANPATVRSGDTAQVVCEAMSPDQRPLTFRFESSRGQVSPRNGTAIVSTGQLAPGPINIRATVTDDRELSAEYVTMVTVEAPPPAPVARKLNELQFRLNSAYVNNQMKAILDDVALRAQREPEVTLAIITATEEAEPARLADQRSQNIRNYLVQERGLDANRVTVLPFRRGSRTTDLWMVPAGAAPPEE